MGKLHSSIRTAPNHPRHDVRGSWPQQRLGHQNLRALVPAEVRGVGLALPGGVSGWLHGPYRLSSIGVLTHNNNVRSANPTAADAKGTPVTTAPNPR
jgi:hypothetical protein